MEHKQEEGLSPSTPHHAPRAHRDETLERATMSLIQMLRERGHGSVLRGWRRELDPDGTLEATFADFCRAAARMGFAGDTQELFGGDLSPRNLTLAEFTPHEGHLVDRFRHWVKNVFGGPLPMFAVLDPMQQNRVTFDDFKQLLTLHSFVSTETELNELFSCADVDASGEIAREDAIFLETDPKERELETFKAKTNRKDHHQRFMAWAYIEDCRRDLPAAHRLAQRPWLADNFEKLPMLVCKRRMEWHRHAYQKGLAARISFVGHLKETYGNMVRAWRRALDPGCTFAFTVKGLRRYCSSVGLKVDINALWKSLDKDCDGTFRLEELSGRASHVLASFRAFAIGRFENCAAIWDCAKIVLARAARQRENGGCWASDKKMLLSSFGDALAEMEWGGANDAKTKQVLLSSLDYRGCGFVSKEDFEWLDKWEPPEWITASPDEEACRNLRERMLQMYQHPLHAWRNLLDLNSSNKVSWTEFSHACDVLDYHGNRGGAWRALDTDLSGSISMDEFDEPSSKLLCSFKEWTDKNFGSVELAFKTLDTNGVGGLTYQDLRRACHKLKWQGEVRQLFDCFDCDGKGDDSGKRAISLKEVAFLDTWEIGLSPEQQAEDDVVAEALHQKNGRQNRKATIVPNICLSSTPHAQGSHQFNMVSLDGLNRQHQRAAVATSDSEPNLAQHATKSLVKKSFGERMKRRREPCRPATREVLFGSPAVSFDGRSSIGGGSTTSSAPSIDTLAGGAPLQNLRQPKPWVERMARLNKARANTTPSAEQRASRLS